MESAEAAILIEQWVGAHGFFVLRTLAIYGVGDLEDRAEIEQEVFLAAFLALQHGEEIVYPRAWLRDCAWRMAANYRNKADRRKNVATTKEVLEERVASTVYDKLPSSLPSPEQLTQDREQLYIALEGLDEASRDLVLDVRGEGINWKDIAAARGITVEQARHIYHKALRQIEANMARAEPRGTKRRAVPILLLMNHVFDSLGLDLSELSPELDRQVRAGLARRMKAAAPGALDPERKPESSVHSSMISITAFPRPFSAARSRSVLFGMLGCVAVLGFLLSHGLEKLFPTRTPLESRQASSTVELKPAEWKDMVPEVQALAPLVSASGVKATPEKPPARVVQRPGDIDVARPSPSVAATWDSSLVLLDRARAAFQGRDAPRALGLMAEHARRFPGELGSAARLKQLKLICTASAARGAPECASFSPP